MIGTFLKNRTVRNAGWLIGGKIAQMLINLVVGLLTARYLGPSNYGLINYAGAYTAFFASLCTLGINSVIVKELIDRPKAEGEVIGTTLVLRSISSFLSALTIIGVVSVVDADEPTTIAVVALCSIGLLFQLLDTFNYWFQSRLQSKVTAIATLVAYAVTAAYKVFLILTDKSVVWFALATSVDYLCIGVLLLLSYRKNGGEKLSFSWQYGKTLLGKSYHYILAGLMVSVYGQTDKLMLKQMINEAEIGYYSTAVSLCNVWCFVLAAIIDSVVPSIMQAHNENEETFKQRNRQLYAIIFYISVFVSLCFTVLAKPAISILYGEAYLPAVGPLRVITWYTAFSYLGVARNSWVVCKERQKYLVWIYLASAAINVLLNSLLIPSFGAVGAAWASLAAQICTTLVVPFFIPALRENSVLMLQAIALRGVLRK